MLSWYFHQLFFLESLLITLSYHYLAGFQRQSHFNFLFFVIAHLWIEKWSFLSENCWIVLLLESLEEFFSESFCNLLACSHSLPLSTEELIFSYRKNWIISFTYCLSRKQLFLLLSPKLLIFFILLHAESIALSWLHTSSNMHTHFVFFLLFSLS